MTVDLSECGSWTLEGVQFDGFGPDKAVLVSAMFLKEEFLYLSSLVGAGVCNVVTAE